MLKEVRITNKEVYEKLGKDIDENLDASDLILLVLLAGDVKGATAMQKQVFIAWMEMYKQKSLDPGYFPWMYGPYSRVVDDLLTRMKDSSLIEFKGRKDEAVVYNITDRGIHKIKAKMKRLGVSIEKLKQRKAKFWNDWSSKGYLQYVYRKYPQYAVNSRVSSYKWE